MVRASMDKFQVAVHAIGDAANAEALDAIADLNADLPGERRWRIAHAQIVDPADIPRFKQLGVIPSMQPLHPPSDRPLGRASGRERGRQSVWIAAGTRSRPKHDRSEATHRYGEKP